MRFFWPQLLWLTLPVGWVFWERYRRPAAALVYSSLLLVGNESSSWRTRWAWLPDAARTLAVALLVLSLARPQWAGFGYASTRHGVAIELLVDISSSMDTTFKSEGGNLSRLEAVKKVVERFVAGNHQDLPGRTDDLIGLITFARYADTISPQTAAHDALLELIRNLTVEDRANEDGTAYGDAVTLAAARLRSLEESPRSGDPAVAVKSRVIVLLTDGENNCGRHLPLEAAALAKAWGIRVYVISLADSEMGLASPGGAALPAEPSMEEQILMRMARETGGIFRHARDLDSLQAVYKEIDSLEKSEIRVEKYAEWRELFPWLSGAALLLLTAELLGRSTVFRRIP